MQLTRYLVLIKMSIEYRVPYQVGTNCLSSTLRSPYIYCYCLILSVTITVVVLRSTSITFGSHYYTTRYSVRTCTAVADRRVLLLCFGSPGPWLRPYLLGLRTRVCILLDRFLPWSWTVVLILIVSITFAWIPWEGVATLFSSFHFFGLIFFVSFNFSIFQCMLGCLCRACRI